METRKTSLRGLTLAASVLLGALAPLPGTPGYVPVGWAIWSSVLEGVSEISPLFVYGVCTAIIGVCAGITYAVLTGIEIALRRVTGAVD